MVTIHTMLGFGFFFLKSEYHRPTAAKCACLKVFLTAQKVCLLFWEIMKVVGLCQWAHCVWSYLCL